MRHVLLGIVSFRRALGLTFAALCLAPPSRAVAQGMSCEQAQTILLKKHSTRADLFGAMSRMVNCGDGAPVGIMKMFRQVTPRAVADTVARQGAWALLDNRLMESVRSMGLHDPDATLRKLAGLVQEELKYYMQ